MQMTIQMYNYLLGCIITFCTILVIRIIQYVARKELELTYLDILATIGFIAMSWIGLIYPVIIDLTQIPWSKTVLKIKRKKKK